MIAQSLFVYYLRTFTHTRARGRTNTHEFTPIRLQCAVCGVAHGANTYVTKCGCKLKWTAPSARRRHMHDARWPRTVSRWALIFDSGEHRRELTGVGAKVRVLLYVCVCVVLYAVLAENGVWGRMKMVASTRWRASFINHCSNNALLCVCVWWWC